MKALQSAFRTQRRGEHGEASRGVLHGALKKDDGCRLHRHRILKSGQRGKTPGAQGAVWVWQPFLRHGYFCFQEAADQKKVQCSPE